MKPWFCLIIRIGQGALKFALGGALIFAVAGLSEGALAGGVISLILLPTDKHLAAAIVANALIIGTGTGFFGGLLGFTLMGVRESIRAELHPDHLRYQPPDEPFWNCTRSALWASAMLGLGGALTGAACGGIWLLLNPPDAMAPRFDFEIVALLIGSGIGAATGFLAGLLTGTLAPHSVQTARRRVKEWRQIMKASWQEARMERQQ